MEIENLVIGKEYDFKGDGVITLIKIDEIGFYIKGSDMNDYIAESDGSIGFPAESLCYLSEIESN